MESWFESQNEKRRYQAFGLSMIVPFLLLVLPYGSEAWLLPLQQQRGATGDGFLLSRPRHRRKHQLPLLHSLKTGRLRSPSSSSSLSSSSSVSLDVSRQNRVDPLLKWATSEDGGASIQIASALKLEGIKGSGLGWKAVKELPAGSVLLQVPSQVALTVESSSATGDRPWFVQMALDLYQLQEQTVGKQDKKEKALNYGPWLDSLPRQFNTPIHWSKNAVDQELQYPYMARSVAWQERTWKAYHQQLQKEFPQMSWTDFLWACECVRSRAFAGGYTGAAFNPYLYAFVLLLVTAYVGLGMGTLEQAANGAALVLCAGILKDFVVPRLFGGGKKNQRYVICPLIDMTNHASGDKATGEVSFEYFGDSYSLALGKSAVPAGSEVFISYGDRSNDQLLQYYGFVEENNPNDVYVLPPLREWDIDALEAASGRTFAPGRLQKLEQAGLLGEGSSAMAAADDDADDGSTSDRPIGVVVTRANGVDPAVLQALRALVSTDAEWEAARQQIGSFAEEESGGAANEQCARLVARKTIEQELESKATTLAEDEEMLKQMTAMNSANVNPETELAIRFRIEKKRLLLETLKRLS